MSYIANNLYLSIAIFVYIAEICDAKTNEKRLYYEKKGQWTHAFGV